MDSEEMFKEMQFVKASKFRVEVMKSLQKKINIPSGISKEVGISTNQISNILAKLKDHELVECINPDVRKGRLYRLTDKGAEVAENLDN